MGKHESTVDFRNLIRDLAEMYPFDVEEVIVSELVANSLDAKATVISIDYDNVKKKLVFSDNGEGMSEEQFRKYHNLAAGVKSRGSGIGFAGIGAKISFNVALRVITETKSPTFEGGSNWHLEKQPSGEETLIWTDIKPSHINKTGTRVEIDFMPQVILSFSNTQDIVNLLRRHYLPLFDKKFLLLYKELKKYEGIQFVVNGTTIRPTDLINDLDVDKVKDTFLKKSNTNIGYGFIGLAKDEYPLGEDLCGIIISVYGKVIKTELFNQFPGKDGAKIIGLFEIPGLISFLSTSKNDFIKSKAHHKDFESFYGPVREFFKQWLLEAGIQTQDIDTSKETLNIERELKKILVDIPELSDFLGFRSRKDVFQKSDDGEVVGTEHDGVDATFPVGDGDRGSSDAIPDIGEDPGTSIAEADKGEKVKPISRTAKRGPKIAFSNIPDRIELAWIEGNTIFINTGHNIMTKTGSHSSKMTLYLVAIGCALQRYLTSEENPADVYLIDRILNAWSKK